MLAFRWLYSIEKQSVTNAVSVNSLRFAQIYFFAMCLFYEYDAKEQRNKKVRKSVTLVSTSPRIVFTSFIDRNLIPATRHEHILRIFVEN